MAGPHSATVILLFCAAIYIQRAHSNLQNLPVFENQGGGGVERIQNDQQVIVPAYYFVCYGRVTQWGACLEPGGGIEEYEIDFQVWRPSEANNGLYTFIGMNNIRSGLQDSCLMLDVPEGEQIQVQPNDVVGFHSVYRREGREDRDDAGVELDDGGNLFVFFNDAGDVPDCTEPGLCTIRIGDLEDSDLDTSTIGAPVITAVVATASLVPSPTPLSDANPVPPSHTGIPTPHPPPSNSSSDSSGLSIGVIIGIAVAGIVLVTLVVLATVGLLVVKLRRQNTRKESLVTVNTRTNSIQIKVNAAYVATTTSIPTAENESYGVTREETQSDTTEDYEIIYEEPRD